MEAKGRSAKMINAMRSHGAKLRALASLAVDNHVAGRARVLTTSPRERLLRAVEPKDADDWVWGERTWQLRPSRIFLDQLALVEELLTSDKGERWSFLSDHGMGDYKYVGGSIQFNGIRRKVTSLADLEETIRRTRGGVTQIELLYETWREPKIEDGKPKPEAAGIIIELGKNFEVVTRSINRRREPGDAPVYDRHAEGMCAQIAQVLQWWGPGRQWLGFKAGATALIAVVVVVVVALLASVNPRNLILPTMILGAFLGFALGRLAATTPDGEYINRTRGDFMESRERQWAAIVTPATASIVSATIIAGVGLLVARYLGSNPFS